MADLAEVRRRAQSWAEGAGAIVRDPGAIPLAVMLWAWTRHLPKRTPEQRAEAYTIALGALLAQNSEAVDTDNLRRDSLRSDKDG